MRKKRVTKKRKVLGEKECSESLVNEECSESLVSKGTINSRSWARGLRKAGEGNCSLSWTNIVRIPLKHQQ